MRYAEGGGLTAVGRARREGVRLQAGRGSGRTSVAALACVKTGQPGRFFYRMHDHRLRPRTRRAKLAAAMRHQLDRIQRQRNLITGFLGQTGLTLEIEPP